jgi:GrpB-like predicted nucleotidyltransferase (UPF0157 family)
LAQVVEICPYDPASPSRFAALGVQLRDALGLVALRFDHIGSTSVRGFAAKPIVDVQVSVAALDSFDAYRVPLDAARQGDSSRFLGEGFRTGAPNSGGAPG